MRWCARPGPPRLKGRTPRRASSPSLPSPQPSPARYSCSYAQGAASPVSSMSAHALSVSFTGMRHGARRSDFSDGLLIRCLCRQQHGIVARQQERSLH